MELVHGVVIIPCGKGRELQNKFRKNHFCRHTSSKRKIKLKNGLKTLLIFKNSHFH